MTAYDFDAAEQRIEDAVHYIDGDASDVSNWMNPIATDVLRLAEELLAEVRRLHAERSSWTTVDGITASMRALGMTAIDLRPNPDGAS